MTLSPKTLPEAIEASLRDHSARGRAAIIDPKGLAEAIASDLEIFLTGDYLKDLLLRLHAQEDLGDFGILELSVKRRIGATTPTFEAWVYAHGHSAFSEDLYHALGLLAAKRKGTTA